MMGHASSPPVPAPRFAAGWWTALEPYRPTALLAGLVTVLRTEVLVESTTTAALDPTTAAVLALLEVAALPTAVLHLGEARTQAILADAQRRGYVTDALTLTDTGRAALAHGVHSPRRVRRRFAFRDRQFLPLPDPGPLLVNAAAVGPGAGLPLVAEAAARSAQWKADGHFPNDFERIVPVLDTADRWHAIAVERAEEYHAVVTAVDGSRIIGFLTQPPDWLLPATPDFELRGEPAHAAFPELFVAPPEADVREAWMGWAKSRAVPTERAAAATVTLGGHRLLVGVTTEFGEWLRTNRADVFAGTAWVWVGDGDTRRAAVLDVHSTA